jgi:hypothetical protein
MAGPSYLNFDNKNYAWKNTIDYRKEPHLYRIGKGEQGVLICQPYKREIGPYWRFKTPEIAKTSSEKIYELFLEYLKNNDFVGADLARKYLQMGYTRARRYANYKGGRKYDAQNDYKQLERGTGEEEKVLAARIFYAKWKESESNPTYAHLKQAWKEQYG